MFQTPVTRSQIKMMIHKIYNNNILLVLSHLGCRCIKFFSSSIGLAMSCMLCPERYPIGQANCKISSECKLYSTNNNYNNQHSDHVNHLSKESRLFSLHSLFWWSTWSKPLGFVTRKCVSELQMHFLFLKNLTSVSIVTNRKSK